LSPLTRLRLSGSDTQETKAETEMVVSSSGGALNDMAERDTGSG